MTNSRVRPAQQPIERILYQHTNCNLTVAELAAQSVKLFHLHGNHNHGDYLKLVGAYDSLLMRVTEDEWKAYVAAYVTMSAEDGREVAVVITDEGYHSYSDAKPYEKARVIVDATTAPALSYQPG